MAMAPKMRKSESEASFGGGNSKMSESRRERLINLKKREDLKDALTVRFKHRFGHGAPERGPDEVSVCSDTIKREVDAFAGRAAVTEANLERLERRLQKRATTSKDADAVSLSGVSAYSGASVRSRSLASLAGESVVKAGIPEAYDWGRLDEYASYLHEQDSLRQMQGVKALQRKMRADLDNQVSEKGGKEAFEKEEDRRYHQAQMVELERWKEREQAKAEEMKTKIMKEKSDRDEQFLFNQKLKADELKKKKDEEAKLVSKIVFEMEQEHKKYEKKKEDTRKAMKKVFEQNMKDQVVREEQKRQQQEKDAQAMADYVRILDEQEAQRAAELETRMSKQKALMDDMQARLGAMEKAVGDNDAMRAKAQKDEMDRFAYESEKAKQEKLKQMRIENQDFLFKQMAEKDARKYHDKELQNLQSQILERDTAEYNEVEKQKAITSRLRHFEHRQLLEKQIQANALRSTPAMSETEIKLNRGLLTLVEKTLSKRDEAVEGMEPIGEEA
eukprot:gnl/TRDRNA2_/TRDRNA2_38339_c0_seq1.p1 gnl/TRDRNA2_/TRDRNA2_38339_c0~~gnl/TRDRNA2_/TRDRNA2_38339_c0_seq1.p1  ORF type:complete len:503 (-),score=166.14 gnl/TRDRNA2_/TRDRNA2_38339_c0_seq1:155-1663(-)